MSNVGKSSSSQPPKRTSATPQKGIQKTSKGKEKDKSQTATSQTPQRGTKDNIPKMPPSPTPSEKIEARITKKVDPNAPETQESRRARHAVINPRQAGLAGEVLEELTSPTTPSKGARRAEQMVFLKALHITDDKIKAYQLARQRVQEQIQNIFAERSNRGATTTTTTTTPAAEEDTNFSPFLGEDIGFDRDSQFSEVQAQTENEIQGLTQSLQDTTNKLKEQEKALTEATRKLDFMEHQQGTDRNEILIQDNRISQLRKAIDQSKAQAQAEGEKVQRTLDTNLNELEKLQRELNDANSKIDGLSEDLQQADDAINDLGNKLNEAKLNAKDKIETLAKQLEEAKHKLNEARTQTGGLSEDLQQADNAVRDLGNRLDEAKFEAQGKIETLAKQLEKAKLRMNDYKERLANTRQKGEELIIRSYQEGVAAGRLQGYNIGLNEGRTTTGQKAEQKSQLTRKRDRDETQAELERATKRRRTIATGIAGIGSFIALGQPAANIAVQNFTRNTLALAAEHGAPIATETAKTVMGVVPGAAAVMGAVGFAFLVRHLYSWSVKDLTLVENLKDNGKEKDKE